MSYEPALALFGSLSGLYYLVSNHKIRRVDPSISKLELSQLCRNENIDTNQSKANLIRDLNQEYFNKISFPIGNVILIFLTPLISLFINIETELDIKFYKVQNGNYEIINSYFEDPNWCYYDSYDQVYKLPINLALKANKAQNVEYVEIVYNPDLIIQSSGSQKIDNESNFIIYENNLEYLPPFDEYSPLKNIDTILIEPMFEFMPRFKMIKNKPVKLIYSENTTNIDFKLRVKLENKRPIIRDFKLSIPTIIKHDHNYEEICNDVTNIDLNNIKAYSYGKPFFTMRTIMQNDTIDISYRLLGKYNSETIRYNNDIYKINCDNNKDFKFDYSYLFSDYGGIPTHVSTPKKMDKVYNDNWSQYVIEIIKFAKEKNIDTILFQNGDLTKFIVEKEIMNQN